MHLYPDLAMQFAQLNGSGACRNSEMPMVAARMSRELSFAAYDEATLTARG